MPASWGSGSGWSKNSHINKFSLINVLALLLDPFQACDTKFDDQVTIFSPLCTTRASQPLVALGGAPIGTVSIPTLGVGAWWRAAILSNCRQPVAYSMPASPPRSSSSFVSMPDEAARRLFAQALTRLSPVQRQAMLLRLRGVADIDDIAARLALSPDSVRASLAFAAVQLRMVLSDTPLDRERDEWLQRCRTLLAALPEPRATPASPAAASVVTQDRVQRAPVGSGLWPRLPAALALLVLIAAGVFAWQLWRSNPAPVPSPVETEPQRMPPPDAPEAPLTAPDFLLVLMQQQHPGVLETLDFYVWLAEQEALR